MSLFGKKCLNRANLPRHIGICVTTSPSFPNGGELTATPMAGEAEEYTAIAGGFKTEPAEKGATRFVLSAGTMWHSRVPADGIGHYAVNEGQQPTRMILIEIKGTATGKGPD
jgi:hypothetical protein